MDPRTKQDVKYKTSSLIDAMSDKMNIGTTKLKGDDTAGLDVAVVKATNTDEVVPKEKHVVTLRSACGPGSGMRTHHVIGQLVQRLEAHKGKWLVTLKTLIVFHRLLREADPGFATELLMYADRNGPRRMLRLDTFADHTTKASWPLGEWATGAAQLRACALCHALQQAGMAPLATPGLSSNHSGSDTGLDRGSKHSCNLSHASTTPLSQHCRRPGITARGSVCTRCTWTSGWMCSGSCSSTRRRCEEWCAS